MCGICGQFNVRPGQPPDPAVLARMAAMLEHRGPEDYGWYADETLGMAHARLSIIDLAGGRQPIANEDESVWVVLNGEIFNYPELRAVLEQRGHRFRTQTDTEVLVHLYEEKSESFLRELNGQFALALWDVRRQRLLLARDRFGIAPLYYAQRQEVLVFASEAKSLFVHPRVQARPDPWGLDQLFTFWSTVPPRTVFKDVHELPPAHYLLACREPGRSVTLRRYWDIPSPAARDRPEGKRKESDWAGELLDLLLDAIRIRLRADVPVASFLSGGLDSSLVSALTKKFYNEGLQTFSVRFQDSAFDEGDFQGTVASFIDSRHHEVRCTSEEIGRIMPEVTWFAEKPLVRTAPAPLFQLAELVRKNRIKVVLTGEGADEVLGGYDLFREMKIRRFWARNPESHLRPALFKRLYAYNPDWANITGRYLELYYQPTLAGVDRIHYSHIPRWQTTSRIKQFYTEDFLQQTLGSEPLEELRTLLPQDFAVWDPLERAQYLEMATLLSGNLLCSQGDRMVMAHGVEARQPFLDHRLVEFGFRLPGRLKVKGLNEKYLLKRIAEPFLPASIAHRTKQPYRAPESASFFGGEPPAYLDELLSPRSLAEAGFFEPQAVRHLTAKCRANRSLPSARENLALVGIVTTLLWNRLYFRAGGESLRASSRQAVLPWKKEEHAHENVREMPVARKFPGNPL